MSTSDVTSTDRVSVPRILAYLLALGEKNKLPTPIHLDATFENGCAGVRLANHADQASWAGTLGLTQVDSWTARSGSAMRTSYLRKWGWFITVEAEGPQGAPTELDAETMTALERIAGGES